MAEQTARVGMTIVSRIYIVAGNVSEAQTNKRYIGRTIISDFYDKVQHIYTVFRKNTHSHFLSYLHELFVDLNKIAENIPKDC